MLAQRKSSTARLYIMSFDNLGLSKEIMKALEEKQYLTPTPIQTKAIPLVFQGKDIVAAAQTGTGKTASFLLPMLQLLSKGTKAKSNQARSLILVPTRELAIQIEENAHQYGKFLPIRIIVVYGGVKINPQMMSLRKGADILIATPGRLIDLCSKNAVKFPQLEILVLDEADRMLDLGFTDNICKILSLLPKNRQHLMFSATFSESILNLSARLFKNPTEISSSEKNMTAATIKESVFPVDKKLKPSLLMKLISLHKWTQVLVFTKTKKGADKLSSFLNAKGLKTAALHGDKSQTLREQTLADFKNGTVKILIATDVAARGLDIDQLQQVVNFDLPHIPENYIHRIGRTGRAGLKGQATSLVSADEFKKLCEIESLIKRLLPRRVVDGFEPSHNLPESALTIKSKKPKKLKKLKKSSAQKAALDTKKTNRHGVGLNLQPRRPPLIKS